MSQIKAERSRNLRYKKAMLDELNIESINDFLWETTEECANIAFAWDDENILEGEVFPGCYPRRDKAQGWARL